MAGLLLGIGLRRCRRQPTIAVDPFSLTIDERMRAEDAVRSILLLAALPMIFMPFTTRLPGTWYFVVPIVIYVLLLLLRSPRTRPWPTWIGQPLVARPPSPPR